MNHEDDAADLETFLREHITSYEQLEILMLLRRELPRAWSPAGVAAALSMSQLPALAALEHLAGLALLEASIENGERAFGPRGELPQHEAMIAKVAHVYEHDRTRLMKILNRNAIERVRARAMQAFTQTPRKRGDD
jgi:hypothetical protein